ncbi:transporter substrate-binding domain-containing protein [Maridesulfovibrio sp.]|uniref:substrate-binding periplasmic protein n=1 Tax=Maridesulfovibrio sp. TaxID=2795000 RepID=UPI002AA74DB6|nr:transporter substrate-binding domain-containing protein [Maridesulfovibrio sp.]
MCNKILSVVFIFILLFPSALHAKKLVFVTLDTPPQTFLQDGKPKGFLVEIVAEAAKRAGYEPDIRIVPWKRAMAMVKKGTADAIFNAGYNEERNKYLRFSETVLITEKVVALRLAGSNVYFPSDFSGAEKYSGGVGRGFYYGKKVDQALKKGVFLRIEEVPNIDLNVKKLLLGRIDFFFADYYPALNFLNDNNLLYKVEAIIAPESGLPLIYSKSDTYLAFSRKKDPEAFEKVNAELKKMKQDGSYQKIISRYIPVHEGF